MASPRQISSSFIFHEDHFPFLQRRRKGLVTRELKFEGEERRRRKRIFDDFFFTGDDGRDPWPMRGGREFKSGSYFRSHRDDNAISAFTRKDLSWRVRHCAFRPDVSVVVKLPPPPHPLSLIDFLLPLSSPISPSGLMEPAKRFSLSSPLPLLTELSEKWRRISRNILVRSFDNRSLERWRRQRRGGKGRKKRGNDSIMEIT